MRPYLPEGEPMYDEDAMTDRSERFLAAEIIREKVFRCDGDELPDTSTVLIDKFETEGRPAPHVRRRSCVERDGAQGHDHRQQGSGSSSRVCTEARLDMEKLFDGKVYLEMWIKVKSGWADNEAGLRAYGYASGSEQARPEACRPGDGDAEAGAERRSPIAERGPPEYWLEVQRRYLAASAVAAGREPMDAATRTRPRAPSCA